MIKNKQDLLIIQGTEVSVPFNWYTGPRTTQTRASATYPIVFQRPDLNSIRRSLKEYRNPVIYARELQEEMVRDNLSRKQLAERHGVSSDRITQWLCLLKLPEEKLSEIEALGDYWENQVVTERELRDNRLSIPSPSLSQQRHRSRNIPT